MKTHKLIPLLCILSLSTTLKAQCLTKDKVPNQYIVTAKSNSTMISSFVKLEQQKSNDKIRFLSTLPQHNLFPSANDDDESNIVFRFKGTLDELTQIKKITDITTIEPDCIVRLNKTPSDPLYQKQWAHAVSSTAKAWDYTTGSPNIVVAVSDTGIDYNHPDLRSQMWINWSERNGISGVDDDRNGCVDDIYGCDLADKDGNPAPGSSGSASHGTHVAGIIGAHGNNRTGVTGVNWRVRLMAAKGFSSKSQNAYTSDLIATIYYAVNNGAHIINCSWGSQGSVGSSLRNALQTAINKNVVVVLAAGNSAMNVKNYSPASFPAAITVASSNSYDQLSSFSNFGTGIDLVAPGGDLPASYGGISEQILSTVPNGRYSGMAGTSMAAPFVAGAAALILSINPKLTPKQVGYILKSSGDRMNFKVPINSQGYNLPRINVYKAVRLTSQKYR